MAVQAKRFNWVRSATGWEQFQAWQERRRAMRDTFESANSIARDGFAVAWSNQISGTSDLAAKAALSRLSEATQTKVDKVA